VKNLQLDWSPWLWSLYQPKSAGVESNMLFNAHSAVHKFWLISRRFRKFVFRNSVFHLWQVKKVTAHKSDLLSRTLAACLILPAAA